MRLPPPLPSDYVYTSCYCEENVYLLCKAFLADESTAASWEPFVVFISNHSKTVALWQQKLAREDDCPVVWDYHVVLALRHKDSRDGSAQARTGGSQTWAYDFDSRITTPSPLIDYLCRTFSRWVDDAVQSLFRLIPGQSYLDYFASDRSHMILDSPALATPPRYSSPPPVYPPIQGRGAASKGITNNLMANFVSMRETAPTGDERSNSRAYGTVLTLEEMLEWCI